MFPLIASCFLFGVYIFFKVFSKEYINLLLTIYFFALGIAALAHLVAKPLSKLWPSIIPNTFYRLDITSSPKPIPDPQSSPSPSTGSTELSPSSNTERFTIDFDTRLILSIGLCSLIGISYLIKKHWLVNNLFGLAFAVNAIELIRLNTVSTAAILLGGLFVYDVFWVFGTEVMVSVAKNFEAPIKLVFPQNLLGAGLLGNDTQMAMLGLGDIVVPGILVALMLRFDVRAGHGRAYYFWTTFWAYLAGLLTTIAVMHFFKHAQPALLYLVPACLLTPFACALVRGEIAALINYADEPEADAEKQKKAQ
jgi:minor histocompatibility antigen H13